MDKIIQIASFAGNIGDVINHTGFYSMLHQYIDVDIEKIEMRKFYRNAMEKKFDENLVNQVNNSKALIIGGGGFFDVRWNDSVTGTTLDASKAFFDSIHVPIIFNAMGVLLLHDRDYSIAINAFQKFFHYIVNRNNTLVSIRNDGSKNILKQLVANDDLKKVLFVPDGAFFYPVKCNDDEKWGTGVVGLCISNSLFNYDYTNGITEDKFNYDMSRIISNLAEDGYKVILFAHEPHDIEVISFLYNNIDTKYFRYNIIIAPYRPFEANSAEEYSRYYQQCDVMVSMRFHSCVLAIDNDIPTIALDGYGKVAGLYEELELNQYCIRVGENDYVKKIHDMIANLFSNSMDFKKVIAEKRPDMESNYRKYLYELLEIIQ